jgi:hypothetical protein
LESRRKQVKALILNGVNQPLSRLVCAGLYQASISQNPAALIDNGDAQSVWSLRRVEGSLVHRFHRRELPNLNAAASKSNLTEYNRAAACPLIPRNKKLPRDEAWRLIAGMVGAIDLNRLGGSGLPRRSLGEGA